MRNLMGRTLLFATEGNAEDVTLAPTAEAAAGWIGPALEVTDERIKVGKGWMNVATETTASRERIDALNRLIEREVTADRAEEGGNGLVIIPRVVLQYVEPALRAHVAAPWPEPAAIVSALIRPRKETRDQTGAVSHPRERGDDNGPRLKAVLARDGNIWTAQAIEIDYAACGVEEADARKRFLTGLEVTARLQIEKHGNLNRLLKPAATELWTGLLEAGLKTASGMRIEHEAIDMRKAGLLSTSVTWIIVDAPST